MFISLSLTANGEIVKGNQGEYHVSIVWFEIASFKDYLAFMMTVRPYKCHFDDLIVKP